MLCPALTGTPRNEHTPPMELSIHPMAVFVAPLLAAALLTIPFVPFQNPLL